MKSTYDLENRVEDKDHVSYILDHVYSTNSDKYPNDIESEVVRIERCKIPRSEKERENIDISASVNKGSLVATGSAKISYLKPENLLESDSNMIVDSSSFTFRIREKKNGDGLMVNIREHSTKLLS